jgi:nitroreductase
MNADRPLSVTEALQQRRSIRAFLGTEVPLGLLHEILACASRAPSGGNMQPWQVVAVAGQARRDIVELAHRHGGILPDATDDRPIYPPDLWEPYRTRRYKVGEDMYALLGIPREDKARRLARLAQNFEFFGAPVALFFVIDERMGHAQWAHLGMFMQSIALVAVERGLSSCFQEIWASLRKPLREHLALPANQMVYCGMAIGYADPEMPVNRLQTEREPVEGFTRFVGFADAPAAAG